MKIAIALPERGKFNVPPNLGTLVIVAFPSDHEITEPFQTHQAKR